MGIVLRCHEHARTALRLGGRGRNPSMSQQVTGDLRHFETV